MFVLYMLPCNSLLTLPDLSSCACKATGKQAVVFNPVGVISLSPSVHTYVQVMSGTYGVYDVCSLEFCQFPVRTLLR